MGKSRRLCMIHKSQRETRNNQLGVINPVCIDMVSAGDLPVLKMINPISISINNSKHDFVLKIQYIRGFDLNRP
jgi:hypothetical protein